MVQTVHKEKGGNKETCKCTNKTQLNIKYVSQSIYKNCGE